MASPHQTVYDAELHAVGVAQWLWRYCKTPRVAFSQAVGKSLAGASRRAVALAAEVARVGHLVVKVRAHTRAPPASSPEWFRWQGNHSADVAAGEMLQLDRGSYERAKAAKDKA
eukprot:416880-Amphidinium_carterae.1